MKRTLVLVTTPPGPRTTEALRCALALTAGGREVGVAFLGTGVLSALRGGPHDSQLQALRGAAALYAELESLGAGAPADGVTPLFRPQLTPLLAAADATVGF